MKTRVSRLSAPSPKALAVRNRVAKVCLKAAVEAAHASGAILMRHFGRKLKISEKNGAGLVTNVDIASEKAALKILRKAQPQFSILTEESPPEEGEMNGRWILDPLDGTTNYVHGFPMFCVSIAAEWEGEIVAGVIYHPVLKDTYTAIRGGGARLNGRKLRVSGTRKLDNSLLSTGFTYRKDTWLHMEMESFERISQIARAVRRPGSAALDLAYTARGVFDGFWERRLSPWDIAAGALLIEEAGGKVTDFRGRPYQPEHREIIAANTPLHGELFHAVTREYCPI